MESNAALSETSINDVSMTSSQYDGGEGLDAKDDNNTPQIPIEFKFKQQELEKRFAKMIKTKKYFFYIVMLTSLEWW